jgi:hypothetical protein
VQVKPQEVCVLSLALHAIATSRPAQAGGADFISLSASPSWAIKPAIRGLPALLWQWCCCGMKGSTEIHVCHSQPQGPGDMRMGWFFAAARIARLGGCGDNHTAVGSRNFPSFSLGAAVCMLICAHASVCAAEVVGQAGRMALGRTRAADPKMTR